MIDHRDVLGVGYWHAISRAVQVGLGPAKGCLRCDVSISSDRHFRQGITSECSPPSAIIETEFEMNVSNILLNRRRCHSCDVSA
jgi:hypothetical protein